MIPKQITTIVVALIALFGLSLTATTAAQQMINLAGGDSLEIDCDGRRLVMERDPENRRTKVVVSCRPHREIPTPDPAPSPEPDPNPDPSPEPDPNPEPTDQPNNDLPAVDPAILGNCSAEQHDAYVVVGPDGNLYRTWHPQQESDGCRYAHEHGDNPASSVANSEMPPFGYIGSQVGRNEPHEGFKVFVTNAGFANEEGRTALDSTRVVAHMGTGGTGRYSESFHSLMVDLIGRGREFHIQQMSDTGAAGSVCNRAGRDFVTLGCEVSSLYEIWGFELSVGGKLGGIVSTAVFDPILVRDPGDLNRKVYTVDVYGDQFFGGEYYGCYRESYHGPFYWYNGDGPTTFKTDAFGNFDPNGPLEQMVSAHKGVDYVGSEDGNTTFKKKTSQCAPGLGILN
jgi:hypothetical protein